MSPAKTRGQLDRALALVRRYRALASELHHSGPNPQHVRVLDILARDLLANRNPARQEQLGDQFDALIAAENMRDKACAEHDAAIDRVEAEYRKVTEKLTAEARKLAEDVDALCAQGTHRRSNP